MYLSRSLFAIAAASALALTCARTHYTESDEKKSRREARGKEGGGGEEAVAHGTYGGREGRGGGL